MKRAAAAVAIVVWVMLSPSAVSADPPAATDYRTSVVAVVPEAPEIDVSIVGGDSFVMLRADRGTTVEVTGYHGEPFLRFLTSGAVDENRASITYFASRSRYGSEVPDNVTRSTAPDWRRVASDGVYAWHDHRTHWMNPFDPPGRMPGDVILEAVLPLVVGGRPTTVTVVSVWEAPPPAAAGWWGVGVGLVCAGIVVARRRSTIAITTATGFVGAVAVVLGWWQFRSVPVETGPSWAMVALPAVALAAVGIAVVSARRWRMAASASVLLAGVELLLWAWLRRSHLSRAILPTNAPWWFDRASTSATLVAASAVMAVAGWRITARP